MMGFGALYGLVENKDLVIHEQSGIMFAIVMESLGKRTLEGRNDAN